jgi:hypothetical protein
MTLLQALGPSAATLLAFSGVLLLSILVCTLALLADY